MDYELGNLLPIFPEGTVLKAYPATNWPASVLQPHGAPLGAATDTQTVTGGTVTFTGLDAGAQYWVADAAGARYLRIQSPASVPGTNPATIAPSDSEGDVLTTVDGVSAWAAPSGGGGGGGLPNGDDGFIRGHVRQDGAIESGSGFTVEKLDAGKYNVIFDEPFAILNPGETDTPDLSVVAQVTDGPLIGANGYTWSCRTVPQGDEFETSCIGFYVEIYRLGSGTFLPNTMLDAAFDFMVSGKLA